jgi:hypothetical protein
MASSPSYTHACDLIRPSSSSPYTHACDLIRLTVDPAKKLTRADASKIRSTISTALGLDDAEVIKKLAEYFLEHRTELVRAPLPLVLSFPSQDVRDRFVDICVQYGEGKVTIES